MVLLPKQVHLQKEVGAVVSVSGRFEFCIYGEGLHAASERDKKERKVMKTST